jgi:dihydroflavonol-4-reductase
MSHRPGSLAWYIATVKTLVTGASGFIGSAVVRKLLARGKAVRCLVEPGADLRNLSGLDVELVEADVNDRVAVGRALAGCDVLYHLAAIYRLWMKDPSSIYEVNVEGTKTVLWAAYKANLERVVHTSSIAAIGAAIGAATGSPPGERSHELADETVPFNLWARSNAYIRSKWLSERDALRFAREGLPLVVVNPSFPFGERDLVPTPTGRFIVETMAGRVRAYPEGGFNCVDVEDVAEGHVLAAERGRVGERYILGGHNVTYREFFTLVAEIAGVKPPTRRIPTRAAELVGWVWERWAEHVSDREPPFTRRSVAWAARHAWYDCGKADRELGLPVTPLAKSIRRSVDWFRMCGKDPAER